MGVRVGGARLVLSAQTVLSTAYLGLLASGVTLLLWTYGARRTPATTSGITTAIPALGYRCAVVAGEAPTWNATVGGLLGVVGVGVAIASTPGLRGPRQPTQGDRQLD